jgi:hypothetical protein
MMLTINNRQCGQKTITMAAINTGVAIRRQCRRNANVIMAAAIGEIEMQLKSA